MSKYLECNTVLGDRKFLVAALAELGYHAEVHPDGAALFGYEGRERPERAHVIIRRNELSPASNDIGFARSSDGRFVALLSEYDQQIGYDRKWLGKVQQVYKEKQTIATARAKGYVFQGREVVQTKDWLQCGIEQAIDQTVLALGALVMIGLPVFLRDAVAAAEILGHFRATVVLKAGQVDGAVPVFINHDRDGLGLHTSLLPDAEPQP